MRHGTKLDGDLPKPQLVDDPAAVAVAVDDGPVEVGRHRDAGRGRGSSTSPGSREVSAGAVEAESRGGFGGYWTHRRLGIERRAAMSSGVGEE